MSVSSVRGVVGKVTDVLLSSFSVLILTCNAVF